MESTLVNKVIFGEYYIGNVMYILLRFYPNIAETHTYGMRAEAG